MSELKLSSHHKHPIVRIGDTVHRPTGWWTPSVHKLLGYLQEVKFKHSPRVLGFDEKGREILSYIEGESGKDGWSKIITDEGLRKYARLLREYHEAIADFKPSSESIWAYSKGGVKDGEIMCHGDMGVWNIVWQNDEPVGLVDWDMALPAKPRYDFLYALEYAAPFRDDETTIKWHHFPEIPDRKHRIKVFAEAYGLRDLVNIVEDVVWLQREVGKHEKYLAEQGLQPQKDWIANGDLKVVEKRARWTEENRHLFE